MPAGPAADASSATSVSAGFQDLADDFVALPVNDIPQAAEIVAAENLDVLIAGANLTNASFQGSDLSNSDFTGATLTGCDFSGAKLDAAVFDAGCAPSGFGAVVRSRKPAKSTGPALGA